MALAIIFLLLHTREYKRTGLTRTFRPWYLDALSVVGHRGGHILGELFKDRHYDVSSVVVVMVVVRKERCRGSGKTKYSLNRRTVAGPAWGSAVRRNRDRANHMLPVR